MASLQHGGGFALSTVCTWPISRGTIWQDQDTVTNNSSDGLLAQVCIFVYSYLFHGMVKIIFDLMLD